ncbi:hypothetical protein BGW38_010217 [Lunasporangiospora selenospora]|uniref:LUD domain-containing protein n=1 Tax=Lunasporangiospora selenospora TaxID=979761 RepID=A0A9P6FX72_9FUNG|nr:hypothetical protein BGW38_010217 [Lunasporangiospora selenospora]
MQQRPKSTFDDVTYDSLLQADPALAPCKGSPYRNAASDERIERARQGLESKGFKTHVVSDRDEAFDKVKSLIPAGASLSTAHSTTLEEIAFVNYLIDGKHPWNNIRGTILAEKDPEKQAALRRTLGTTPDYFLTSMCAVTEEGQMSHGDYSGTKVGPVSFGAGNVIVVVGSNKIVKDEAEAWKRTKEHCLPFVASYSRKVLKLQDSAITHYEVIRNANPLAPNRIQVVLIKEALGF